MKTALSFCWALLALSASTLAAPAPVPEVKKLHETTLDLLQLDSDNEYGRFAVRVSRTDELIDVPDNIAATADELTALREGTLIAERIHDVVVMFDVSPKGDVSVNGVPVPIGMTNLKIEADVVTGVTVAGAEMLTDDQIDKEFDRGLIGMQVHVDGATVSDGIIEFTRLIISEQITEVNGVEVLQENAMQQVVEIHPGGRLVRQKPCHANPEIAASFAQDRQHNMDEQLMEEEGHNRNGHLGCLSRKVGKWFRHLPVAAKISISVVFGLVLGFIAVGFSHFILTTFFKPAGYAVIPSSAPFVAVSFLDEKKDEKLPVYTPDGFVLPADDKKSGSE
ncbi:hypothetical protein DFS34DRAFT_131472 [Phlyctochytrium arcticum]|nr:hypothetical protein DFS34DRAFT_131472 [Phlyctochytrium arcticum]